MVCTCSSLDLCFLRCFSLFFSCFLANVLSLSCSHGLDCGDACGGTYSSIQNQKHQGICVFRSPSLVLITMTPSNSVAYLCETTTLLMAIAYVRNNNNHKRPPTMQPLIHTHPPTHPPNDHRTPLHCTKGGRSRGHPRALQGVLGGPTPSRWWRRQQSSGSSGTAETRRPEGTTTAGGTKKATHGGDVREERPLGWPRAEAGR